MANKEQNFNSEDIISFLWAKRKIIIICTTLGVIGSVIFSFMITELYKSTAIVYPARTSSVSLVTQLNPDENVMNFGTEEEAEQLLQILMARRVKSRIVELFNLFESYEIEMDDPHKNSKLNKMYEERFTFERTKYGSVKIEVLDEDPEKAMLMANKIVDLLDSAKNEMIQERALHQYEIVKSKYELLKKKSDFYIDTLNKLQNLGVIISDARGELYSALANSSSPAEREYIREQINVNNKYGSVYDGFKKKMDQQLEILSEMQIVYEQAETDANSKFTHKFIVELAEKADKKFYPVRWLIVVITTISVFLFTVLVLLILNKIKELQREQKVDA
ncbi:MAG: Wzz/FepE/Etk N-terminal domain-containing protein [Crocinitomicaceae bacterium]